MSMGPHRIGCPAAGSSAGAVCNCGMATGTEDRDQGANGEQMRRFITKLVGLFGERIPTKCSYAFRAKARDEFEQDTEWGFAVDLELINVTKNGMGVLLKYGNNAIDFPLADFEYRDMKCTPQRVLQCMAGGVGSIEMGGVNSVEDAKKARTERDVPINPDVFETIVPYMLSENDRMMTQMILANRFRINSNDGVKSKKLAMFMAWGRTANIGNPESMQLGEELFKALRVADVAQKTGKPEWMVYKELQQTTSDDPFVKIEKELGKKPPAIFQRGRNWARPSYQAPVKFPKPPRPPRTCKFCGDPVTVDWEEHKCPKKPK